MAQRTATASAFRRLWALLWLDSLCRQQQTETALARVQQDEFDLAAMREVDALTPSCPEWHSVAIQRPSAASRAAPFFFVLVAGAAIATGAAIKSGGGDTETCTFSDGTTVEGQCIFDDAFNTFNSAAWLKENDWVSALLEHASPWGCVREESVTIESGELVLGATDHVRGSCPQSWGATSFYDDNFETNFPVGSATAFDTAAVTAKWKFRYGTFETEMKMAGGTGWWTGLLLWGEDCQDGGAMHQLMEGIFNQVGDCLWPAPGAYEFDVISYVSGEAAGTQPVLAFHRDEGDGAPFLRNFFSTPYYGIEYTPTTTADRSPFITPVAPNYETDYQKVRFDWRPGEFSIWINDALVAKTTAPWVDSTSMAWQFWNVDAAGATGAPQSARYKYLHGWCQPGVPCTWSGPGTL